MNDTEIILLESKGYETDDRGHEKEVFEEIPIFADEKSIRSNEFYEAQRKGIKLDRMFVIKPYEYNYQTKIKYDNDIYTIERTYKKNTEELELICSKVK
ncbi:phage head closure protein (plasmid) [Paraclostridium bifermentans]|uniref:Phage head closure protein n=1 Tax=Paraclostridium bifermentans TaxID=1490 RepID=A0ABY8R7W2_PARBF|nr:phage head closure protein [Paraclostridium bifermentans]